MTDRAGAAPGLIREGLFYGEKKPMHFCETPVVDRRTETFSLWRCGGCGMVWTFESTLRRNQFVRYWRPVSRLGQWRVDRRNRG